MKIYLHCVKSVQIQSVFWSVFSDIGTEYEKIRLRKNSVFGHFSHSKYLLDFSIFSPNAFKSISLYSVRMWENPDQKNSKTDTFHALFHSTNLKSIQSITSKYH